MGRKESKQTFHLIITCADPEGGGGVRTPSPGKAQVIWVSSEISICTPPPLKKLDPLENVGPPLDPWKWIVFSVIKALGPLSKL